MIAMTLSKVLTALLAAATVFALTGCDSNPTNEPSQAEIDAAKAAQIKAIDADTTMSAEDKQRLKQMKGLAPGGVPGAKDQGRGQ